MGIRDASIICSTLHFKGSKRNIDFKKRIRQAHGCFEINSMFWTATHFFQLATHSNMVRVIKVKIVQK